MELYSENKNYKLYHGNMLDMLDVIELNSIDSIVTDPPYELNFMGKGWDNAGVSFQKETWKKCFDVLKPGGYLLAFGGSRTFHRIACAIEDAGFEIRDTIMWLYGCYSADTQVLTDSGWKYFFDLDKTERVLQWDKDTNELTWTKPINYFEYDVDTEMCLFENRHISQLVTPNHKIAVRTKHRRKDYGDYELCEAKDIKKSWLLKFPLAGNLNGDIHEKDAYIIGWWLTDAWKHADGKACMFSQSKLHTLNKLRNYFDENNIKYSEYIKHKDSVSHLDEHTFYVTGDIASKLLKFYPDRELTWDMLNWDRESRLALLEGLLDGDGSYKDNSYSMTFWSQNAERCDIVQAICLSLNYRAMLYYKNDKLSGVVFNTAHNSTETQTRHHKPNVPYTGKAYCLQTETGAFVVRRNGKAFISGNSGFPKSMNIGLAIDKKTGVESEVIGYSNGTMPDFKDAGQKNSFNKIGYNDGESAERIERPLYKAQNKWAGWGTALKPSFEPIIVARKPCEGTCVDNVLKWGVGGINIDECRVAFEDTPNPATNPLFRQEHNYKHDRSKSVSENSIVGFSTSPKETPISPLGRFPANTILTYDDTDFEEVCGGFPCSKHQNGSITRADIPNSTGDSGIYSKFSKNHLMFDAYNDSGSASRYFYCAKASKRDREEGMGGVHKNIHPT